MDRETVDRLYSRMMKKTTSVGDCTLFLGGANRKKNGYGIIFIGRFNGIRKRTYAHRLSYEYHHGPIFDGMVVMHSCDNSLCVNPEHLSVGTQLDNIQDMVRKGRARSCSSEKHWAAKLNMQKAEEIRRAAADGVSREELAVTWKVCPETIMRVVNRERWV